MGVRSALAPGDSVRIMLHYSQGGSAGGTQWFFDHMDAYGVPYDLIGLSYYPWWHGTLAELRANLQRHGAALRAGTIMVVETSYPWRAGGWESMATNRAAMTWPVSPSGQAKFLRDVRNAVAAVPDSTGAGVVWWYPGGDRGLRPLHLGRRIAHALRRWRQRAPRGVGTRRALSVC